MSKSIVNAIFKEMGIQNVKMSTGSMNYGMPGSTKVYKEDDKMVKGIPTSSYGPITCTDIYLQKHNEIHASLMSKLTAAGIKPLVRNGQIIDGHFVVSETKKKLTTVWIRQRDFPAYTRSANLDPGYKNLYIVPTFHVEDKEDVK